MAGILQKFWKVFKKTITLSGKKEDLSLTGCENTKPNIEDSSYDVKIKKVKINTIKIK